MTTIKAIETRYAGCRFRSRLEARWAVFFDHMNLEWEYEPQGFELSSGPYLPDFYLPIYPAWVEIKGAELNPGDSAKCSEFAVKQHKTAGAAFLLLQGEIPRPPIDGIYAHFYDPLMGYADGVLSPLTWTPPGRLNQALTAARSARFEHGERG